MFSAVQMQARFKQFQVEMSFCIYFKEKYNKNVKKIESENTMNCKWDVQIVHNLNRQSKHKKRLHACRQPE